jgi:hypothetical protein
VRYLAAGAGGDHALVRGREHRVPRVTFGDARRGVSAAWDAPAYAAFRARFALRAQRRRLRTLVPSAWRTADGEGGELPPPDPCRTCHKLLGA